MGLIAHPGEITGIAVSSDGNYLFTSGGGDFSVNMWHIDIGTMEQTMFNSKHGIIFNSSKVFTITSW